MYVYMYGHVCVCINICACMCICMCGCIDIHACMCVHVESIYAGMCAYRFIHVSHRHARVWTCAHACIYTHAFIHIYMYIDMHVCVNVCICMCWCMCFREVLFILSPGHQLPGDLVKMQIQIQNIRCGGGLRLSF